MIPKMETISNDMEIDKTNTVEESPGRVREVFGKDGVSAHSLKGYEVRREQEAAYLTVDYAMALYIETR